MQSILDVIINPQHAIEGARQVVASLGRIKAQATETTTLMDNKFARVKQSLFSLQSAFLGLGAGVFAKSLLDVTRNLDMAERGLRAVTTSSGQAAVQLDRIRKIADEFMFEDLPMANAFRLLASHDIPNAEKALKTLGNVALTTGENIETVVTAMLSGQERTLRKLGVRLIDLGTGQVDMVFGNMEIRANKTDAAIRRGLLQLFEKGFPDATAQMANDMDFQIKRIHDGWEDFRIAIMRGGLGDFLTATFRQLADGFNGNEMQEKGKKVAESIQAVIVNIAKDIAFVMDLVMPLASALGDIFGTALKMFAALPPMVQTLGIFGVLFFGWQGMVALTAGLYLADQLGLKAQDIAKSVDKIGAGLINAAGASPLGGLIRKTGEMTLGKGASSHPANLDEKAYYVGLGESIKSVDQLLKQKGETTASYSARVEKFFNQVADSSKKVSEQRKKAEQEAKAERAGGGTGVRASGISDEERVLKAQINKLHGDTNIFISQEEDKRNRLFDPDKAQSLAKSVEFINQLREKGLPIEERHVKLITEQFMRQAEGLAATRVWLEVEAERANRVEATNVLLAQGTTELQAARDASMVMALPVGDRDLETARLSVQREMMRGKVFLQKEERQELDLKLVLIDREQKSVQTLQLMEQQRLSTLEETSRLIGETGDMTGGTAGAPIGSFPSAVGTSAPSGKRLMGDRQREFETKGLDFDKLKAQKEIDVLLEARRANFIARTNFEIQQQIKSTDIMVDTMGMMTDERQKEIRVREAILALQQKGVTLTAEETAAIGAQQEKLQKRIASERTATAINSFVDSFRVGWDTIVKSGEQAYSHLEDAMVQWITTGKMDLTSFTNFVQQELIRMGIRASISQLTGMGGGGMGGGGGGGGGLDLGGLLMQGIGAFAGSGASSAGFSQLFSGNSGASNAAFRGMMPGNKNLGPGFQRGGVFDYSRGSFKSYYDIPGAQRGMVSNNERLLRISEGHTPEAVIPLKGGKVPVSMSGGGNTIHAPITIMTPDAAGVRRSETQIQAQMSATLMRASRRIG